MASRSPAQQPRPTPVAPLPFPPPRLPRRALPRPLTSLVGRRREAAEIGALLALDEVRLLTLTGPGGVGKTRLALRVAEELGGAFRDGVVFVDLAQVRDPEQVVPAIARTLDLREVGGRRPDEGLPALLQGCHLLLVLDNLEQVLDAAPDLADLLLDCPGLKILATSREPLRVSGEQDFPVPPLSLAAPLAPPAGIGRAEAADPSDSDAVQLFVARAHSLQPDFALDGGNVAVVADICRRVDGLPLGIELAAARLRHLSIASLLGQLDRRLPLLTGGPRDAPARLQTMRDAIAWSHDLLSPKEQSLFRRLSVFVGGFTLGAAEAVSGDEFHGAGDTPQGAGDEPAGQPGTWSSELATSLSTLDLIASLVDKSLLFVDSAARSEMRYGMLETIREFGQERLAATGEDVPARRRHAEWCLAFAERAGPHAKRPDAAVWLDALEREHANLRAALSWLAEHGQGRPLLRLAGALWPFWQERTYFADGRHWLELALDHDQDAPAADRLRALTGAGTLAWYQMDIAQALQWHEQALALARRVGDRESEAWALINLAAQASELGDFDRANASCEAGLAVARAVAAPEPMVLALHNLAHQAWRRGDGAAARRRLEESLALAREHRVTWLMPTILIGMGFTTMDLGDHERAAAAFRESLDLGRVRGNFGDVVDGLEGLARVSAAIGQMERAVRLLGAAASIREEIGKPEAPSERAYIEPILAALREALGSERFATTWAAGLALSREAALAEAAVVPSVSSESSPRTTGTQPAAIQGLTAREREILRLLARGESNREIGEHLFISPTTVARHVANIFGKLGVDSRAKATAYGHLHGLD